MKSIHSVISLDLYICDYLHLKNPTFTRLSTLCPLRLLPRILSNLLRLACRVDAIYHTRFITCLKVISKKSIGLKLKDQIWDPGLLILIQSVTLGINFWSSFSSSENWSFQYLLRKVYKDQLIESRKEICTYGASI